MYPPQLLEVIGENYPFTLMIAVSLHLAYHLSSHVNLCFWLYFFWRAGIKLLGSVSSKVRALNKPGGGKKMHSVSSFNKFVADFLISSHEMGWSSSSIISLWLILSSTCQSMGLWFLNALWKCGPNTELFSAPVVASFPLVRHILMIVGEAWWLMSPPVRTRTLCQVYLGLNCMECILSSWWAGHAAFESDMESYTVSYK